MAIISFLVRLATGLAGLAVGSICAKSAWEGGTDFADLWGGAAFVGITAACWFVPAATRTVARPLAALGYSVWAISFLLVLMNTIGFAAKHRTGGVAANQNAIEAYDRAVADRSRLIGELTRAKTDPKDASKPHPRWVSTAGCSDSTVPKSDAYCSEIRRAEGELAKAREALEKPRPLRADPQAASLRKILPQLTEGEINDWWPILIAIGAEIIATGAITLALAPARVEPKTEAAPERPQEPQDATWLVPFLLAAMSRPEPPQPTWLAADVPIEAGPDKVFGRYSKAQPFGRMDGRTLRHFPARAANEA